MKPTPRKQLHALNALKVVAIALVFNSHSDALYPISALATGGALGNSLFFIISGYLLKINSDRFFPWIKKRFLQLYPGMWIAMVINAVAFSHYPDSVLMFLQRYIWPTGFWFVGGLLLFNTVIFFLEKRNLLNRFVPYAAVMCTLYVIWYILFVDKTGWHVEDHGFFRLIYYFFLFSFGYFLKTGRVKLNIQAKGALLGATVGAIGNIGWKFVLNLSPAFMATQFICQVFCILFAIMALQFALTIEDAYCRKVPKKIIDGFDFWSKYSLEMYFSQRAAQWLATPIAFPLNFVVAIAITLVYALLLKKVTAPIVKRFS